MRRLKVGHAPSTVRNCPRTASEVVDNTIGTVNVFKKQRTDDKASQSLVADGEATICYTSSDRDASSVRSTAEIPQLCPPLAVTEASHLNPQVWKHIPCQLPPVPFVFWQDRYRIL
jgi:hypothetical protein